MGSMYPAMYLEANLLGILVMLLVLVKIYKDSDRQTAANAYRRVVVLLLLIMILDSLWVLVDGVDTPFLTFANCFINAAYMILAGLVPCMWLYYIICTLHGSTPVNKWLKLALALPMVVLTVMSVATPWTNWLFEISQGNIYKRGSMQIVQPLISYGYIIGASIYAFIAASKEPVREKRQDEYTMSLFAILPILGGVLNLTVFGMPSIWPLTAVSLLLVFLNLQSQQLSTDGLTGLNNRRQFDKYFRAQTTDRHSTKPLCLLLIDIDHFKNINDTYGHLMGDGALIHAADILKKVCSTRNALLARYGGDEFAIMFESREPDAVENLKIQLIQSFEEFNDKNLEPYKMTVSFGESVYTKDMLSPLELIVQADKALYIMKESKKEDK